VGGGSYRGVHKSRVSAIGRAKKKIGDFKGITKVKKKRRKGAGWVAENRRKKGTSRRNPFYGHKGKIDLKMEEKIKVGKKIRVKTMTV